LKTKPFPSPHHLVIAEAVDVPAERLYLLLRFPADSPALGNLWRWSGSGVPGTAMWEEGGNQYLQHVMKIIYYLSSNTHHSTATHSPGVDYS